MSRVTLSTSLRSMRLPSTETTLAPWGTPAAASGLHEGISAAWLGMASALKTSPAKTRLKTPPARMVAVRLGMLARQKARGPGSFSSGSPVIPAIFTNPPNGSRRIA